MSEHIGDARELRAKLPHPVIDTDGHWIEYGPHITAAMQKISGDDAVAGFHHFNRYIGKTVAMTNEARRDAGLAQESWWSLPTRNTRDRATAMLPNLLRERLDEFGIDFGIVYPTSGLGLPQIPHDAQRQAACFAFNTYVADYFSRHSDRLTPAAVIPMYTPEEAIDELHHAKSLGLKVIMMGSMIKRPIPELQRRAPELVDEFPWLDVLGVDSPYNYDPVWQCCQELGFSPTFHTLGRGRGFGLRHSASNFTYNHIGHFAAAAEAVCKALIMGGVTHRFPTMKFGFLEGGVGWACQLLCDLIGHWEKRNVGALDFIDPRNLDEQGLLSYVEQYGQSDFLEIMTARSQNRSAVYRLMAPPDGQDDFSACGFNSPEDIVRQFTKGFYFGCEADDPMNAWAFKSDYLPLGASLNTLFGSDIGHFDVQEMAGVLPEAHELLDDALITKDDFRDFVFANAVSFYSESNPDFFKNTVIEKQVSEYRRHAAA